MMRKRLRDSHYPHFLFLSLTACLVALSGCGRDSTTSTTNQTDLPTPDAVDGEPFLLADEPEDAKDVITAREDASDGDEVVIVGRIGGSENPWVAGRAAFSIVDESLKACSDIPGDQCQKPWDYCCATDKLPTSTALVKVIDGNGAVVKSGAKQLLGVKELSTVVVTGKAQRDELGNLTVLASGVFVRSR